MPITIDTHPLLQLNSLEPKAVTAGTLVTVSGWWEAVPFNFDEVKAPSQEVSRYAKSFALRRVCAVIMMARVAQRAQPPNPQICFPRRNEKHLHQVPLVSVKVANRLTAFSRPENEPFGASGTRCGIFNPDTGAHFLSMGSHITSL
jgi:hypothetical protein